MRLSTTMKIYELQCKLNENYVLYGACGVGVYMQLLCIILHNVESMCNGAV